MTPDLTAITTPAGFGQGIMLLLILLMIREMVWKGIALWKAGTNKRLARFVCLFIFNTAGILPIIYLVFFQKKKKHSK
jgi:methionyl-tRNA synthetase